MKRPEILAPAGSAEQLYAAVRCGADAVYLGTDKFNARSSAENFSEDKLSEAIKYCHARDVKVYVTMNTLINDNEIDSVISEIKKIAALGADAVITQDLAVAKLWKTYCPEMKLHASTQMTIHNVAGAKAAVALGFKRIVLARELSLDEIRKISSSVDAEIEVFVHGALCMSVSGTCLLSSIIGARSGNRGKCAQPCRLNFKNGERSFALSLKDLSVIDRLSLLESAGVTSFKIEGRMKRPEYVAAAVDTVKKAINKEAYDISSLRAVFSRSGFTSGYLDGMRNLDMFGYRRREDVTAAAPVLKELEALYKDEPKKIPINAVLVVNEEKSSFSVSDGNHTVTVEGDVPEKAINRPLSETYAASCISKTGGTIFYIENCKYEISEGVTISASQLNNLRRNALDLLYEKRGTTEPKKILEPTETLSTISSHSGSNTVRLRFERYAQMFDCPEAEKIILPAREILKNPQCIDSLKTKLICELPTLVFTDYEPRFSETLDKLKSAGVTDVIADNIGVLYAAAEKGFNIHGGHGLNIMNSVALAEYVKMGAVDVTVTPELNMNLIGKLKSSVNKGILAYGFIPLMRFRVCPVQSERGCEDCKGITPIQDRYDTTFYVLCSGKKYSSLLNSIPLYVGDKNHSGADFSTLYFTFENPATCKKIFTTFTTGGSLNTKKTGGLYFRELL